MHGLVSFSAMESILDLSVSNNFELTILFQPEYEGKIETRAHCSLFKPIFSQAINCVFNKACDIIFRPLKRLKESQSVQIIDQWRHLM